MPVTVTVVFAVAHCGVMPVIATLTSDPSPSVLAVAWVFAAARAGLAVAARAGASAAGSVTAPTVSGGRDGEAGLRQTLPHPPIALVLT